MVCEIHSITVPVAMIVLSEEVARLLILQGMCIILLRLTVASVGSGVPPVVGHKGVDVSLGMIHVDLVEQGLLCSARLQAPPQ